MAIFDIVILVLAATSLIVGFSTGFIMQVALLAGVVLGAIFAGQLAAYINPYLLEWTGSASHLIGPISYVISFILILMALTLIGKLAQSVLKAVQINFINRLAGAVFSLAAWLVIISIILNVVVEIDKDKAIIGENTRRESHAYSFVKGLAPKAIPYLRFEWVPPSEIK